MLRTFKLLYSDDYRCGPELTLCDDDEIVDQSDPEEQFIDIDVPISDEISVYFLSFLTDVEIFEKIGPSFKTKQDAKDFAKTQYYLRTGNFPFVTDNITSSCHRNGERKSFPVSPNEKSLIQQPQDTDMIEFLVITNGDFIETFSLNEFAAW